MSIDANFGLVHKRSSGKSQLEPRRSIMFLSDRNVDAATANPNNEDTVPPEYQVIYTKI